MASMIDNSKRTGAAIESHYQFLTWLVPTIEKLPKSHKFTIGDRIQTTSLDVLEALIEATYSKERTQHLRQANLGIEKLRFLLRLAADLRVLDRRRYEHAARTLDDTGRLIGGLPRNSKPPSTSSYSQQLGFGYVDFQFRAQIGERILQIVRHR
jgi:23S rRNA-intervening sequence protein